MSKSKSYTLIKSKRLGCWILRCGREIVTEFYTTKREAIEFCLEAGIQIR